jgi:hypothetical protein
MTDPSELVRTLSADESAALAPLPASDEESPTTARSDLGGESTAEAHRPGLLREGDLAESGYGGEPNPSSIEEQ